MDEHRLDFRRIACALLISVLKDFVGNPRNRKDKFSAACFIFSDSKRYKAYREFWCAHAGIEVDYLQFKARKLADAAGCTPASGARRLPEGSGGA